MVARPAAPEPALAEGGWKKRAEAAGLLSEVMSRLHASDLQLLQFIPASPAGDCGDVARAFAIASVAGLGRTLLIAAGPDGARAHGSHPASRQIPQHGAGRGYGIAPDPAITGLYHMRLQGGAPEMARIAGSPQHAWAGRMADFRMLVVASASPDWYPETLLICPFCRGSVLTVAAGLTRLDELQATARQLQQAGGVLLGTVLHDAPRLAGGRPWRRGPV